jgi:hypothetical protein
MKYYLKNLKTDKMNEKDMELLDILNELKLFSKTIVVYTNSPSKAVDISRMIENLDHDNNVKIFSIFKKFISFIKESIDNLDLVLIEVDEGLNSHLLNVIKVLDKLDIKYILFSDHPISKDIIKHSDLEKYLKIMI